MKRLSFIALILWVTLLTVASPLVAKDIWTSVRTRNFFLIGNASEKEIKQVGVRLEQFREVFTHLFKGMNFSATVPTTVVVFKSDSSYRPFKRNANTAGYFQPGPDVNYITLTTEMKGEQNPFSVIFHEYTHLLINNTIGAAPTWFSEGLAEYYSTFTISDDRKIVLGKPIASHVFLLRDKILPLRTLFQVDHKSPYYNERDKQSIFYAESWALLHYLILGNNGQRVAQIGEFIKLMDAGLPMDQAFQKAFQTTFEKMERELRQYVRNDRYPIITGAFEQKLEFDAQVQTAPLSEAEAQAYLGDLLLHSNSEESESYLQKALTLDPTLEIANASLAMLRVRQGRLEEALQSLERAVRANSQNYLIHYYYAFALSREGMTDKQLVTAYSTETLARIRDELKKTIQLRPDFSEAYRLLAFVNLVDGTQLDESIEFLKRALQGTPGRSDLLLMLAQIYLRKQNYKGARQILERLNNNGSDAEVQQLAQSLLAQVETIEKQLARYQAAGDRTKASSPIDSSTKNGAQEAGGRRQGQGGTAVVDPSLYLREALRKPAEGEKQVQGMLLRVECDSKGLTIVIQTTEGTLRLVADSLEDLDIVTFTTDAGGGITCGQRNPEDPIVVCYVPASQPEAKVDGRAISLEIVPKDFRLNPEKS